MKISALHDSVWLGTVSYTSEYRPKMEILILSQRNRPNPKYVSLNYVSPRSGKFKEMFFFSCWTEVKKKICIRLMLCGWRKFPPPFLDGLAPQNVLFEKTSGVIFWWWILIPGMQSAVLFFFQRQSKNVCLIKCACHFHCQNYSLPFVTGHAIIDRKLHDQ